MITPRPPQRRQGLRFSLAGASSYLLRAAPLKGDGDGARRVNSQWVTILGQLRGSHVG